MKLWSIKALFLVAVIFVFSLPASIAQHNQHKKDSVRTIEHMRHSHLGRELERSITRRPFSDTAKHERSEDKLMHYQGKIIRSIHVERIGFHKSIYNIDKKVKTAAAHLANSLHTNTHVRTIKQHLFFHKGQPLNPYRLADNERYLRDLDFILDCRIIVESLDHTEDSVDIHVITRDVFSLGGRGSGDPRKVRARLYDANLMGYGQRIDVTTLFQYTRTPRTGFNVAYRKSSIFGSLANLTLGYTQLDNGSSYGTEYEYAYYARVDRPLVSPYSRWAGGIEVSHNWSNNAYQSPDSLFLNYRYNVQDYWVGYNIGTRNNTHDRTRHFVALRYFQQQFVQQPEQSQELKNRIYNHRQIAVASVTFYEQNFYKSRYVYGFGRTEDVPYGTTLTATAGWTKELSAERPYASVDFVKSFVKPKGNFYTLRAAAGGYLKNELLEDAVLLLNASVYSHLITYKKIKVRQLVEVGYTDLINRRTNPWLVINNYVRGFTPDSLYGSKRIYARSETTLFTSLSVLGFRWAVVAAFEGGLIQPASTTFANYQLYPGFSAGLRTRNENLIFGTMELRGYYFPVTIVGVSSFGFRFTSNLRIKYSGGFVKAPDLLIYN
jgi:hypothetical protein